MMPVTQNEVMRGNKAGDHQSILSGSEKLKGLNRCPAWGTWSRVADSLQLSNLLFTK